jgi:hypothetical protein
MKYSSIAQVTNTSTKQHKIKKTNLSINKRLKTIQPITKQLVALGQVFLRILRSSPATRGIVPKVLHNHSPVMKVM